jgi:hypothetical protein
MRPNYFIMATGIAWMLAWPAEAMPDSSGSVYIVLND